MTAMLGSPLVNIVGAHTNGGSITALCILNGRHPSTGNSWDWSLVQYLKKIKPSSQNWPTWSDLTSGRIWNADPALKEVNDRLLNDQLAFIVGGQGSGKTAVTRMTAFRLHSQDYEPIIWDFEHFGAEMPMPLADFWYGSIAYAHTIFRKPLIVLENVHLNVELFHTILGLSEVSASTSHEPVAVVATSRTRDLNIPAFAQRLRDATVSLDDLGANRGSMLLAWWLEHILQLEEPARAQILQAVPWSRYMHDFWVLKLALDALDRQLCSLPMWAVENKLRDRVARTINANPGIDDLLYLVSGLGRSGLSTDLRAAARMLGISIQIVMNFADAANTDGLISIDQERRSCRFWHDSLAECYWDVFALERDKWALLARERFSAILQ